MLKTMETESTSRRRRARWLISTALLIVIGLALGGVPAVRADAANFVLNETTFGPNEQVIIEIGTLTRDCDFIVFTTSDIYIVPRGTAVAGADLKSLDPAGQPNTIQTAAAGGLIVNPEIIALTAPSGNTGAGEWDIVEDTCQNGTFDGSDSVLSPGFTITLPANIPDLPANVFDDLKNEAGEQADFWTDAALVWTGILIAYDVYTLTSDAIVVTPRDWADFYMTYLCSAFDPGLPGTPITPWCPTPSIQDTLRLHANTIDTIIDQAAHWAGIAADPPDPNFGQPAIAGPTDRVQVKTDDPVEEAVVALSNLWGVNEAMSEALLASLEKYQGAQAADDGAAALMHARNIRQYALLLAANLDDSNPAIDDLLARLQASGRDLEGTYDGLKTLQDRVKATGLSQAEVRRLKNRGLTEADLEGIRQTVEAGDFTIFQRIGAIDPFFTGLKTQNRATAASLRNFAAAMDDVITALAGQSATNVVPIVDPGGPYAGDEGAAVAFDSRGSTDPQNETLTYAWDLDGDGQFDDAAGPTPTFTYPAGLTGLVGVKATNDSGRFNIAYAPITITEANRPPTFNSLDPANDLPLEILVGSGQTFQAGASDPDGDGVTLTWLVNDVVAGTGPTFTMGATASNAGLNSVKVQAGDGRPLGGTVDRAWIVLALFPDGDADGWRANVDCDDADAGVNPGRPEIVGNGKDDDCNPLTEDTGAVDLRLAKDDGQPAALPGQTLTYTLTVSNAGTAEATGVQLTDTLPAHVAFLAADGNGTATGNLVAWPLFDLPAGAGVTRLVTVRVNDQLPAGLETLTNTAAVSDDGSQGPDPTPGNNTAADLNSLPANLPPTLSAVADQTMAESTTSSVTISAVDPNQNPIVLAAPGLPPFGSFSDEGGGAGTLLFRPEAGDAGAYPVTIVADDGLLSASTTFTLTVTEAAANLPPSLPDIADQTVEETGVLSISLSAVDPNQDPIVLAAPGLPPFGSFSDEGGGAGTLLFRPEAGDAGAYPVTIVADDGLLSASTTFTLTVTERTANAPPTFTPLVNPTVEETKVLSVAISASDPDQDAVTLSAADLPDFGTFTAEGDGAGTLVVTPGVGDAGSYPVTIVASDGFFDVALSFTLIVIEEVTVTDCTIQSGASLQDPFCGPYSMTDLGSAPGLPPSYGGLTFKVDDLDTILIGGEANREAGKLYAIEVARDATGHITGFTGTATPFAEGAYNDGGVTYGPEDILFLARWPVNQIGQIKAGETVTSKIVDLEPFGVPQSVAALRFVPAQYPGQTQLKLVTWSSGHWYTADYTPDGTGTYNITGVTLETQIGGGPEGFIYVPTGSPLFSNFDSMLVSEWSAGNVVAYDLDDNGDPVPETRTAFISGLSGAEGAVIDPLTGDFLFSTFGGGDRIVIVRGFAPPPNPGKGSITIVKAANPADGGDFAFEGDLGRFTLADGQSFTQANLAAGSYTVREDPASFPDPVWNLVGVTCQGNATPAVVDSNLAQATIALQAGEQIVCTFRNERSTFEPDQNPGGIYLPLITK